MYLRTFFYFSGSSGGGYGGSGGGIGALTPLAALIAPLAALALLGAASLVSLNPTLLQIAVIQGKRRKRRRKRWADNEEGYAQKVKYEDISNSFKPLYFSGIFSLFSNQVILIKISCSFFQQNTEDKLYDEMELFENFFAKQPHESIR